MDAICKIPVAQIGALSGGVAGDACLAIDALPPLPCPTRRPARKSTGAGVFSDWKALHEGHCLQSQIDSRPLHTPTHSQAKSNLAAMLWVQVVAALREVLSSDELRH